MALIDPMCLDMRDYRQTMPQQKYPINTLKNSKEKIEKNHRTYRLCSIVCVECTLAFGLEKEKTEFKEIGLFFFAIRLDDFQLIRMEMIYHSIDKVLNYELHQSRSL